ncbi:hypothetical protein ACTFIY_001783 [Dictyostelium cf. discoideum]
MGNSSTHDAHYIKQMIELLGLYRCGGADQSDASLSNVFIIPILTGTTTILQQEIHLSKWTHKSINLTPLNYESCKEIIKHRFNIPILQNKPTTTILEDKLFIIFIRDLGVIPRYLQWLLDLELMKNIQKEDIDIPSFISGLGIEIPVSWNTIVCDKTIEYWSYTGHLFLQYDEAVKGNVVFVPIFDLYKIAQILKISDLEKITKFPLIEYTKSTSFEENTAILILNKINTFVKSRICFELSNHHIDKKYLMVVINTKFSTCEKSLTKTTIDDICNNCTNLKNHYKESYILPILITNFKVNKAKDYKGKVIIYHSKNIHLFFGKLWHRVFFGEHDKHDFISPNLCERMENINISGN